MIEVSAGINRDGPEEAFVLALAKTHHGMAHLAGSGPVSKTCRECAFWMHRSTWSASDMLQQGLPKPSPCHKYAVFTMSKKGDKVPHDAMACKHFEQAKRVQPLRRPEKSK